MRPRVTTVKDSGDVFGAIDREAQQAFQLHIQNNVEGRGRIKRHGFEAGGTLVRGTDNAIIGARRS